jgi:hypothetical protein
MTVGDWEGASQVEKPRASLYLNLALHFRSQINNHVIGYRLLIVWLNKNKCNIFYQEETRINTL